MVVSGSEQPTNSKLPDLYQLLDLQALESDRTKIEAALKRVLRVAIRVAKDANASDARAAKKAARLLELGKLHLLDAKRKTIYDERWTAEFGDATRVAPSSVADWKWSLVEPYLPSGDPELPFDLSAFLADAATLPSSDTSADFEQLANLLGGKDAADDERQSGQPERPKTDPPIMTVPTQPIVNAVGVKPGLRKDTPSRTQMGTQPYKAENPKSIARKLRSNRDRSLLFTVAGVLVSLAVVLGLLYVVLNLDKDSNAPRNNRPLATNPGNTTQRSPGQADAGRPRRSGLPRVSGLDAASDMLIEDAGVEDIPRNPATAVSMGSSQSMSLPEPPSRESPSQPSTDVPMVEPAIDPQVASPEPELTALEKKRWLDAMTDLRAMLGMQDYAEATDRMVVVQKLARTQQQKAQFSRLMTVANLAQEFHESLVAAIDGLSAAETFTVRSTRVSFVGSGDSRVTLRIGGNNQTFQLTQIPIAFAWSMADLKMDVEHPRSRAMKAAFAVLHPNNELVLARARTMMLAAAVAEQIPQDTPKIFEDDYQL